MHSEVNNVTHVLKQCVYIKPMYPNNIHVLRETQNRVYWKYI